MKLNTIDYKKYYVFFIITLTLLAAISLSVATYYINYWPTDSESPYIPAARYLFNLPYISQIHDLFEYGPFKLTMRAKETLILGIAIMQRFFNDYESLFPNVFLLILAVAASGILIYSILRKFFDEHIAFFGFILFTTYFLPYMYILQGAHPPLVLMNFLLAVFFLQNTNDRKSFYFLSGIFLGFMLFSSPTSAVYLPYYLGVVIFYAAEYFKKREMQKIGVPALLVLFGFGCIFLLFTLPDPVLNVRYFFKFIHMSQHVNNFFTYKKYLSQFFDVPASLRGGGWVWIIKYFFLIMPVLFSVYLISLGYLLKAAAKRPAIYFFILLSLSTPICVEIIQVDQFGRNYFSWLVGILWLVCFALHHFKKNAKCLAQIKYKITFAICLALFLLAHIVFNAYAFFEDVFPSRLVTTHVYDWFIKHRTNEAFTYPHHPRYMNIVQYLNNTKHENKIYFWPMDSISQVKHGYILVPPINGKTIWCDCREGDFLDDPALTELFESSHFYEYVVATFKSLASSRMWTQEEGVCSYRDLIVGDITSEDRQKGFVWILDADKLQREWFAKKNHEKQQALDILATSSKNVR